MTEINIERKQNNFWPWLIGIIVILAVVVGAFFLFADERTQERVLGEDDEQIERQERPAPGQVPPPGEEQPRPPAQRPGN